MFSLPADLVVGGVFVIFGLVYVYCIAFIVLRFCGLVYELELVLRF